MEWIFILLIFLVIVVLGSELNNIRIEIRYHNALMKEQNEILKTKVK